MNTTSTPRVEPISIFNKVLFPLLAAGALLAFVRGLAGLGIARRYCHDADIHPRRLQEPLKLVDFQHRRPADCSAHQCGVRIERRDDFEALWPKAPVLSDRLAEPAHSDQDQSPLPVDPQDFTKLREQTVDVVAPPLLPEPSEIAEVLADLCRCHIQQLAQRLGAHNRLAAQLKFGQCSGINREAVDNNFWDF